MTAGQASEIIQLLQVIFATLLIMTAVVFHLIVYWRLRGLTWPWSRPDTTKPHKERRRPAE
jgi:Na+/serine symporter